MIIQRTIPPAAAPVHLKDLLGGIAGFLLPGKCMRRLETELRDFFGVKHVFLVSSGKAALTVILRALKSLSPDKTEVLIPAYTCFSVPSAVVKAGLKVSLYDLDPSTLDFDNKALAGAVNKKTLCVVPTHLFGIPSDIGKIREICRGTETFVVEDAAQAMGGRSGEKLLGTLGDVGFFSLGRGKNITCGSGGIIVTNSDKIADAVAGQHSRLEHPRVLDDVMAFLELILMAVFIHPSFYWLPAGTPFLKLGQSRFDKDFPVKKFSGMKAGILRNWRRQLGAFNKGRSVKTRYFMDELYPAPSAARHNRFYSCLRLPVIVENEKVRNNICSISNDRGFGVSPMYPTAIDKIEEIKAHLNGRTFPSANMISHRLLTLPTHNLLSKKDEENICKLIRQATDPDMVLIAGNRDD